MFHITEHLLASEALDFAEARDSEWQWNQLGHTVCKSA